MRGSAPIFIMLVLVASLHGATLTVDDDGPGDYADIQSAVQAAKKGDTILLADGVYRGPKNRRITFDGKALTVTSRNGPERCIMDCELKAQGFYLYGTGCVVEGITVINGWDASGAGIYCDDKTSATIRNCIIRDNACSREGAGVFCGSRSQVVITDCIICSNVSEDLGGGIRSEYANLTLDHCLIAYNRASSGGGLSCGGTSPQVIGCTFVRNVATTDGGGVQCGLTPLTLLQCVFLENRAGRLGGGLCLDGSEGKVVNCTLAGNTAEGAGGLYCSGGGSVQLINSILANHVACAVDISWPKSAIIQGCLFHNNQLGDVYSEGTATTGADHIDALRTENRGNRAGDPHFAVPGDVRLTSASPCIEGGIDELGIETPATDLDGNPRIIDAGGGTPAMDIGACEYDPRTPSIAISTEIVEFVRKPDGPEPEPVRLMIGHGGGGQLNWRIDCNCPWLRVEPASGVAADAPSEVTLSVDTANLPRGMYQTIVEVRDPQAVNSPRRTLVILKVQGALAVPGRYSKIQDAIDASVEGETVEVRPGVYQESLVLRKPIRLVGVGGPILTAPPSYPGIDIQISGCTVSGFEVRGGSTGIYVGSSDNRITDNKVQGSREGLLINGSSNTLLNNEIADCSESGLYLFTGGNTLQSNQMHGSPCNFRFSWVTRVQGRPVIDDVDTTNTVDGEPIYYLVGQSNVTIGPEANAGCVVAIDCRNIQIIGQTLQHNAYGVYFANTTDSQIADC
ncbi:MAG: right-handed parallel beta-helix repeat-containing protein, partial [Phycisphaerales bacterium]